MSPLLLPGQNVLEKNWEQAELKVSAGDTFNYFLPSYKLFKFKEIQIITVFLELSFLLPSALHSCPAPYEEIKLLFQMLLCDFRSLNIFYFVSAFDTIFSNSQPSCSDLISPLFKVFPFSSHEVST